ncbi:MAG: hypothetical protein RIR18_1322 [Pseudomonadota bacterium]|jgi:hypothetical protein
MGTNKPLFIGGNLKKLCVAIVFLISVSGTVQAEHWHDRGHSHFGVSVGVGPYWGPWYYPPPPYYHYPYPQTVIVGIPPSPVYIEQAPQPAVVLPQTTTTGSSVAPMAVPPAENYWYYCPSSKAYYPYVKECPAGWQKVSPQPPPPPSSR